MSGTEAQQFNMQAEGNGSLRQGIMCAYSHRQRPFRNYSLKKIKEEEKQLKAKGKIKEIQHGVSFSSSLLFDYPIA